MDFDVIAISRTLGAGGERLGEMLADELGFRYVDAEILDRAAALAGVTPAEIARAEGRKGLLSRIVASLGQARTSVPFGGGAEGGTAARPAGYEQLIVDVIRETAAMQYVVIVAHGASIPLAGQPGLLRLLVTASKDTRVARVAAESGVSAAEATRRVDESDKARADFFRRFFAVDEELPTHYDLVINTDVLDIGAALGAILAISR